METRYRDATAEDVDFLVENRLAFVGADENGADYGRIRDNTRAYFEWALAARQCDVVLAEAGAAVVGTGIVFYYRSVPSVFNPSGENAYITGMHVEKAHRRRGIATGILDRLVGRARQRGCGAVHLQATEMGAPLYARYGFGVGKAGMLLKLEEQP